MKKRISILMALCLLLSCALLLPTAAEADVPSALSYCPLDGEGAPGEPVALKPDIRTAITQSVQLVFDESELVVLMNNTRIPSGTVIRYTGTYRLQAFDANSYIEGGVNPEFTTYMIEYAPQVVFKNGEQDVKMVNGSVYQFYPTLYCDNAYKIEAMRGTVKKEYTSGGEWPFPGEFGEFTFTIFGNGSTGGIAEVRKYTFTVYPCVASKVFDTERQLYTLLITTGSFSNAAFELLLDGSVTIPAGSSHTVRAVGEHSLELFVNGEKADSDLYNFWNVPKGEDLALRIEVELESTTVDYPTVFNFSRWDAAVLLDGKPVSGDILIDGDGEHRLTVVDAAGNEVENCFLVRVGEGEGAVQGELTVTFDNPHNLYVIFILIPAALMLAAAVCFLVLRRKIV
jgi:hypothetical protein